MAQLAFDPHSHCELCGHQGETTSMLTWGINELGQTETSSWDVCDQCKTKFDSFCIPYRVSIATRNLYAEK